MNISPYLNEAARRAQDDKSMRVHSTTKSVDLRINKLTVASIRPGYIGQQAIADEIAKRYNSEPKLRAAAARALQLIESPANSDLAKEICNALKEALR